MESVEEFLAYSIKLEQEAALRFGELADAMESCGNKEVGKLFRRLSDYSKMHMADAMARAGWRDLPPKGPDDFQWPDMESPESAAIWAADPMIGREQALEIALAAETSGYEFYKTVLDTTADPEIKAMAEEFVLEESEHVAELRKWIAAHKAGKPLPVDR
jgi:rubrerythrin